MKSSVVNIPWKHYLLNNCLTTNDFDFVSNYSLTLKAKKESNLYFIESYKDSPNRQYVPKKIKNILHDLGKRCAELLEIPKPYEIFSGIMILKPDYRYNVIHTDAEWKTATLVLGLSDTGTGTSIYETAMDTMDKRLIILLRMLKMVVCFLNVIMNLITIMILLGAKSYVEQQ